MSMFSLHYLIANTKRTGEYWSDVRDDDPFFWGNYEDAIRFHSRESAQRVLDGVLVAVKNCKIIEDE